MTTLLERAKQLEKEVFLGGPLQLFETAGRMQLQILLKEGLYPDSKVLDIGCGCLRGGYWLIHFLDPGCYFGIEPERGMLEAGMQSILEPGLMDLKRPRFDDNPDFDFSVFGQRFDFLMARSIWTHASKSQIGTMLDGFIRHSKPGGVFLTSYKRASWLRRDVSQEARWVGKSHESDLPGIVSHSFRWIQRECHKRGLFAEEINEETFRLGNQRWLKISVRTT
jgi:cyclopropane fatty-acyl-phospholipid synthase-like methyltransferase